VGANVTTYSDTGLTPLTTYAYRVRASNLNDYSDYSNTAIATTLTAPPAAPTNLGANAVSSSQIDLSWTDNSNDETAFKIERSTDAGLTFGEIATVTTDATTFTDTGLAPLTTYTYQVRASNSGGDSAYSNTATAITLP
jgi:hypothetical protein